MAQKSKVIIDPEKAAKLLAYNKRFILPKPGVVSSKNSQIKAKWEIK